MNVKICGVNYRAMNRSVVYYRIRYLKKILIYMEVGNPTFVYHQEELSNKNVVFAGAHITECP